MDGVRRPYYSFDQHPATVASGGRPVQQETLYLFHNKNGDDDSNGPRLRSPQPNSSRTDSVPSRCASEYTSTSTSISSTTIPTTGRRRRFEKNNGEKIRSSDSKATGELRTIAEQVALHYDDGDERPPTAVASA
jgi:hypothetical protein